jgi:prolyl-tRNA synthetase
MGSYGIGITRLMGTIVEVLSDEKGIIWPESVAPFKVHLLSLGDTAQQAESIYSQLTAKGIEVLFDDRIGVSAGAKFADSDLLGIPHRIVVSDRSLAQGGIEYKKRNSDEATVVSVESLIQQLTA